MKTIKHYPFLALVLISLLGSCSSGKKLQVTGNDMDRDYGNYTPDRYKWAEGVSNGNGTSLNKQEIQPKDSENDADAIPDNYSASIPSVNKTILPKSSNDDLPETKTPTIQKLKKMKSLLKKSNKIGSDDGRSGLGMFIIGLLMIGLGFIFLAYLGIIGYIFFLIFLIGGGIYALIGLIKMLSGS